jgi:hypothetical protein
MRIAESSDDLTMAQARAILDKTRPMQGYLYKLRKRIDERRFPHDDPFRRLVSEAFDKMQNLNVDLHHRAVKTGCGDKM